jgi:hypothetical protein
LAGVVGRLISGSPFGGFFNSGPGCAGFTSGSGFRFGSNSGIGVVGIPVTF